jgi:hypothetical protein
VAQKPRELQEVAEALELADEEREAVGKAGIGQGLWCQASGACGSTCTKS